MSQSKQITPTTFTYFTKLPPKVQLMIYKYMLPGPRRVHMTFHNHFSSRLTSRTPIPALLHLNRDARYEALKHYRLQFGTSAYEPCVYFNPAIDSLFFGPDDTEFLRLPEHPQMVDAWPCHEVRNPVEPHYCRLGCGHRELDFFWRHVAEGCSGTLLNIGIDLRINQADLLHFFHKTGELEGLEEVTVQYPQGGERKKDFLEYDMKVEEVCELIKTLRLKIDLKVEPMALSYVRPGECFVGNDDKVLDVFFLLLLREHGFSHVSRRLRARTA